MKKVIFLFVVCFFEFAFAGQMHFRNKINTRNLVTFKTTKNFKISNVGEYDAYSTFHVMSNPNFTPKEIAHEFSTQIWDEIYNSNNLTGYYAVWNNPKLKSDPDKKGSLI